MDLDTTISELADDHKVADILDALTRYCRSRERENAVRRYPCTAQLWAERADVVNTARDNIP